MTDPALPSAGARGNAAMEGTVMKRSIEGHEAVDRLFARLADALRIAQRDLAVPLTVAEIYQELVPYRVVRDDVGFGMNADYEHALLRLLAGEGGLLRLEPVRAREAIARELKSPNPNVSIYREYAGCDVYVLADLAAGGAYAAGAGAVDLAWLEAAGGAGPTADDGTFALVEGPAGAGSVAPAAPAPAAAAESSPPAVPAAGAESSPPVEAASAPAAPFRTVVASPRCAFCDSSLPAHRTVRFCPYCGGDRTARPCGACGEAVEAGWSYCVVCGAMAGP
jgi:hypothetical protein